MVLQDTKKIFFWVFGIAFGGIVYFLMQGHYLFSSNESSYIPLAISLVVFFLFFVVGIFASKISSIFYLSLNKNIKLSQVQEIAKTEDKERKLKLLIKNLRKILNYVLSKNYSKESIKILSDYIGLDKEMTNKLIASFKKVIKIRLFYWGIGVFLACLNTILILNLPIFETIRTPIFVPIFISIIIFFLFFIEGFLITRLPESIYLEILNVTEKEKETRLEQLKKKKEELTDKEGLEKRSIKNIRNTIKYLIEIDTNREWILNLLVENGFSKEVAEDIILEIIKERDLDKSRVYLLKQARTAKELLVTKIHEDFRNLRNIYQEVNYLQDSVTNLEDKENVVGVITEEDIEINRFTKTKQKSIDSKITTVNDMKKRADYVQVPTATPAKYKAATQQEPLMPKNLAPKKQIDFLFVLIKPYLETYTREELESLLLSMGYSIEIVDDVLFLVEEKNLNFKKENPNDLINKIGETVDKIVKK